METSGHTALHSNVYPFTSGSDGRNRRNPSKSRNGNVIFNRKERIYYEQFIKKVPFNR